MMTILYKSPIKITLDQHELLVEDKKHQDISSRTLSQMHEVTIDKEATDAEKITYFMYRAVKSNEKLRFDITEVLPDKLGEENNKTYGHYHPKSKDGIEYPEIYQVIEGTAIFLLQKHTEKGIKCALITTKKGEAIIIPPKYGHVTINKSTKERLVLANLVCENFQSDYSEYKEKKGAAVYIKENKIEINKHYNNVEYIEISASEWNSMWDFSIKDLLKEFVENPKKFEYLEKPSLKFKH